MLKHRDIEGIEFEPHPLWFAVDMNHFNRFNTIPYCQKLLTDFVERGKDGWYGAKFALNPGVKAMEWAWLPKTFPNAKFIFIYRNSVDTYKSYYKQDKNAVRGCVPEDIYFQFFGFLKRGMDTYCSNKPKMAVSVHFENLVNDTDITMFPVWELLGIPKMTGLNKLMKKPENWRGK